jgi:DNA-binding SARP family transcriptional activator/tetratricopeptide (TPR) repeat protein
MEFRILGPLEVMSDDGPVEVRGAKPRGLLGLLLMHANEVVPPDRLIDDLWEGEPPRSATATLQTYVSQLRKSLGLDSLLTRAAGYVLEVEPAEFDALRFELAVREVEGVEQVSPESVVARLHEALGWWRGPALADFEGALWARPEATRLEALRFSAIEKRVEARLALGDHTSLIPELESLVGQHPLRERLWALLILALYRSDRQAEALRAYARLRGILGEEFGIEPSRELARLEEAVLLHDPELDWQPARSKGGGTPAAPPSGVVTFLLTDIVGSTALWEQQPKVMAEVVTLHHALVAAAVAAHHGSLLKARGERDSTFSVFARATDALNAALAAQRALHDEPWPESVDLSLRMALHSGEAFEREGDYYGPAVNRAARIRGLAFGGQVLLSQSTVELVQDDLPDGSNLVELGAQSLVGLARPESVSAIVAPGLAEPQPPRAHAAEGAVSERLAPPAALRSAAGGPFVGRTVELEALARAWEEVRSESRRAVFIAGEPGVGKSRLVAQLANIAYESGGAVLYGGCDEDLRVPYQPWLESLRAAILDTPGGPVDGSVTSWGRGLSRLVPEVAPHVAPSPPQETIDPETERYLLYRAVVEFLARMSIDVPVLLVLEDLHWADGDSLSLLRYLVASADPQRLLVVGTYRTSDLPADHPLADALAALHRERGVERIELGGLSDADIVSLLDAVSGHPLDGEGVALAHTLSRETDGNPFFAGEIWQHLIETGEVYRRGDGRWMAGVDLRAPGKLPTSVREVIGRRIARLGEEPARTLEAAAVIGREFDLDLLARVAGQAEDHLIDVLDGAMRAALVSDAPERPGRLSFSHALVEHTLYDGIAPTRRQRLHGRIAASLEDLCAGDPGERLGELAYHWTQASTPADAPRAIDYALRAADDAVDRLAPDEAIRWYRKALELLDRHRARDETTRCHALIRLGFAQRHAGDPEYRQTLLDAAHLAERLGNTTLLVRAALEASARGMAGGHRVDEDRVRVLEAAVEATTGGESPERAMLLAHLGSELHWVDPQRAVALSDEALAVARRLGDDLALWSALGARAMTIWSPATLDERSAHAREQRQVAERLGNPYFRDAAAGRLIMAAAERGDLDEVDEHLDTLTRSVAETDLRSNRQESAGHSSWRRLLAGDIAGAERAAEEARRIGADWSLAFHTAQLYEIRRAQGRLGEIVELLEQAVATNPNMPFWRAKLVNALCELERIDDALIVFEPLVVRGFHDLPFDATWLSTMASCAETAARLQLHEASAALVELLAPWRDRFVSMGITCSGSIARPLGLVLAAANRLDEADHAFAEAAAIHERIEAPIELARTHINWAHMLATRKRPGDTEKARGLLEAALETADRLGLGTVERDARELLDELSTP